MVNTKNEISDKKKLKKRQNVEDEIESSISSWDIALKDDSDMEADESEDAVCIFGSGNFSEDQRGES